MSLIPMRQGRPATRSPVRPSKRDRWLVGLVAGGLLTYLLGRALGLGRRGTRGS